MHIYAPKLPTCGSGLDNGPCNCVDSKTHRVKLDRCGRCCGKCNKLYKVWWKLHPRYTADIKADSALLARQAGFRGIRAAAVGAKYTDMRARRYDRIPKVCADSTISHKH